jgi:hypothetical protein
MQFTNYTSKTVLAASHRSLRSARTQAERVADRQGISTLQFAELQARLEAGAGDDADLQHQAVRETRLFPGGQPSSECEWRNTVSLDCPSTEAHQAVELRKTTAQFPV